MSNFVAPAIASLILPFFDIVGVVWAYTGLYLFAGILTFIIKVPQPKREKNKTSSGEMSPVEQ
ncbi:polyol permease [Cedecea neteri]|nr:polyol permease [Cedecea neteri]